MNAAFDAADMDAARAPRTPPHPTHKLKLLLRREFWEHKGGFFWAPIWAGGISLLLTLMARLPLVPFANTLPAIGVILLALGMAERDGVVILLGYAATLLAAVFVWGLLYIAAKAGSDPLAAWDSLREMASRYFGM